MIYVDLSCTTNMYNNLLQYIFSCCNYVSFHMPNFNQSNTDSSYIMLNNNGEINVDYNEYVSRNDKLLKLCEKNGAIKYISKSYMGMRFGYVTQIYYVKLFNELKEYVCAKHLFDWNFEDLPEDLCFFSNKLCRFATVSHESQFVIYNEVPADKDFLIKNKFSYFIKKDKFAPKLNI